MRHFGLCEANLKKNRPESVGEILAKLTRSTKLGRQIEEARIWEWWPEIAGAVLVEHGRPHAVRDGTLTIEVDSAVWMNKFAYHKWDILKQINRRAKRELVSDIFLLLTPDEEPMQGSDPSKD